LVHTEPTFVPTIHFLSSKEPVLYLSDFDVRVLFNKSNFSRDSVSVVQVILYSAFLRNPHQIYHSSERLIQEDHRLFHRRQVKNPVKNYYPVKLNSRLSSKFNKSFIRFESSGRDRITDKKEKTTEETVYSKGSFITKDGED